MKWLDGSEMDTKGLSGEALCEKLALEMYSYDEEQRLECDDFLQNAMHIIDFDSECVMGGFFTPYTGNIPTERYQRIIDAFRAIGDEADADILSEALRLDMHYSPLLEGRGNEDGYDELYDEFSGRLGELEESLYMNTDRDMWAMLYAYLDSGMISTTHSK